MDAKLATTPPKTTSCTVEDSGLLRSDNEASPSRDSPSRRQRLLGSLRSMKSLRTLRSGHASPKKSEDEPAKTETPQTPIRKTPLVSLDFEASPVDVPMFGRMTRAASCSSSLQVHHSSPITVPVLSRDATPAVQNSPLGVGALPNGTVPESPAPLHKAFVQEAIMSNAAKGSSHPASLPLNNNVAPLPTPMPGTNLTLEDVAAPDIKITSPSAPSIRANYPSGYFDSVRVNAEVNCERTDSLKANSGYVTYAAARIDNKEDSDAESGDEIPQSWCTVPGVEPASFDEPFSVAPMMGIGASRDTKVSSSSNNFGEHAAYIVYDSSDAADADEKREPSTEHIERLTSHFSHHSVDNGASYDGTCATSYYRTYLPDSANSMAPELTERISPQEAAAEAKLLAALEELDTATLPAKWLKRPLGDEKTLRDMVRDYERLHNDPVDTKGDVSHAEMPLDIAQEMKEEVETSIRVMNRTLGG